MRRGRVWAIESNTHFRPKDYAGHPTDRLLVFSEMDAAGRLQHVDQFADGFTYAMSVAVRPSGEIFVATRRDVFVFSDADGNLRADGPAKRILQLDTAGDYPHNGLAGFAFDAQGWLYIGCGENLGADYQFSGSDGTTLSGGGEGGNIYRCRYDGTRLEHLATGFWNPHDSCVDAFGRLFTVDNDPDYRPPCRLVHIVSGGDYGFRYRNGRRGIHPFTAWDGELPGTLPMVAGTGEAPSGVVAYESDGLPEDFIGNLLATSWGDHRIDRFRLKAKGISFTSRAEPVITGGENFRPVGLAVAPDGSLFCTDWVLKDYTLHRHGRIWRIAPVAAASKRGPREAVEPAAVPGRPLAELKDLLHSKRIEVRRAAAGALAADPAGFNDLSAVIADPQAPARAPWKPGGPANDRRMRPDSQSFPLRRLTPLTLPTTCRICWSNAHRLKYASIRPCLPIRPRRKWDWTRCWQTPTRLCGQSAFAMPRQIVRRTTWSRQFMPTRQRPQRRASATFWQPGERIRK